MNAIAARRRSYTNNIVHARIFLILGSLSALVGVALGAFGAHALRERLSSEMLNVWHTAVEYHFIHALGLLIVGILLLHFPTSGLLRWSGWLMFAGIVLFSGSLYVLALTGTRILGAITPFGGVLFIVAWALLAAAVW
jgi:uncharacterized membrane protein YgdD (TMEM256/DUF423 family)